MTPKYPSITVPLSTEDGNAFAIIGRVTRALRRARTEDPDDELDAPASRGERLVSDEEIAAFTAEAMSGDYDHVLQTVMRWVDVS